MKFFTLKEVKPILEELTDIEAILVGGQAIAFWTDYYDIDSDVEAITRDVDFYGSSEAVEIAGEKLSKFDAKVYIPSLDDYTPNSGKITCQLDDEEIEIDFLQTLTGLSDDEIEATAVETTFEDQKILVLHPLLCMESKLSNLATFVNKRNKEGIEQARLSIKIVNAYLSDVISDDENRRCETLETKR